MDEYRFTTGDLATELQVAPRTVRKRAEALGLGIGIGGRAGFRYSAADRARLIESMRPTPVPARRRKRRTAHAP